MSETTIGAPAAAVPNLILVEEAPVPAGEDTAAPAGQAPVAGPAVPNPS